VPQSEKYKQYFKGMIELLSKFIADTALKVISSQNASKSKSKHKSAQRYVNRTQKGTTIKKVIAIQS
jgi:hypothetical protein